MPLRELVTPYRQATGSAIGDNWTFVRLGWVCKLKVQHVR